MGNIHVKLYEIWTCGLGGDAFFKIFLICSFGGHFVQRKKSFVQFWIRLL